MNHRYRLAAIGVNTLALVLLTAGCGDFESGTDDAANGVNTGPGEPSSSAPAPTDSGPAGPSDTVVEPEPTTPVGPATPEPTEPADPPPVTPNPSQSGGAGGEADDGAGGEGDSSAGGEAAGGGGTSGAGGSPAPVEASCDDVAPCGGDVVGTWASAACPLTLTGEVDMAGFGLGCTLGTVTSGSLEVTGTITFSEDGMFMDGTTTTGEQELELPPECLDVSGTITTCDRIQDPVRSSLGYATFECLPNEETQGCSCVATINQEGGLGLVSISASESGSYTTSDTSLVITASGEDTEYAYCATEENTMVATFVTIGKIGTMTGPIVFQRQ